MIADFDREGLIDRRPHDEVPLAFRVEQDGGIHRFPAGEPPMLRLDVESARELDLDLTLSYCQAADERLCKRLVLPIAVAENGPFSVEVPYSIPVGTP
ncbi:MAG: hypothetical protein M5U01_28085 [Ardenticatenaceae bacterium]|nr:hypothetical protein [Ardenticatenaceae bacterium]